MFYIKTLIKIVLYNQPIIKQSSYHTSPLYIHYPIAEWTCWNLGLNYYENDISYFRQIMDLI